MNMLSIKDSHSGAKRIGRLQLSTLAVYLVYCFFEPYLNVAIGSILKYYILFICAVFLLYESKLRGIGFIYLLWFGFKCFSIVWGQIYGGGIYNSEISLHFLTQLAMILLIIVSTSVKYCAKDIRVLLDALLLSSAVLGFLALFFSSSLYGRFDARQTLMILGVQNDPNDTAAYFSIAIAVAGYSIFVLHKKLLFNTCIVLVNTFALLLTASRGGLVTLISIAAVLLFASRLKQNNAKRKIVNLSIMLVICIVAFFLARKYLPLGIYERLFLDSYGDGSGRWERWVRAFNIFLSNPVTGHGWGGYYVGTHNTYLTMLCDVGLIGITLFLTPIIKIIYRNLKRKEVLPLLIVIAGFMPAIFIEAINKRFFWNAILLMIILDNYYSSYDQDTFLSPATVPHSHYLNRQAKF